MSIELVRYYLCVEQRHFRSLRGEKVRATCSSLSIPPAMRLCKESPRHKAVLRSRDWRAKLSWLTAFQTQSPTCRPYSLFSDGNSGRVAIVYPFQGRQ